MLGAASIEFVYSTDYWGYKSKSWTEALSKNANCTYSETRIGTLVQKLARICVGEKMCVGFFLYFS